jgi:cytochrome P450
MKFGVIQVMSFLIAGRDTTACAMTWIIFELCQNLSVLEKVLEGFDFGVKIFEHPFLNHFRNQTIKIVYLRRH